MLQKVDMEFIVTFLYMLLGSFCSRENTVISNCRCQIHVAEVQFKYNSEFTHSIVYLYLTQIYCFSRPVGLVCVTLDGREKTGAPRKRFLKKVEKINK